jgi:hypothetical protein
LKAEDLYDKEKVDLETIVIDDVFTLLQCSDKGLDNEEATRRLNLFGPNKLEQEEQNAFLQVSAQDLPQRSPNSPLPTVPQFYVESPFVGHGDGRSRSHRFGERRASRA